jgi:hypothetical protein
MMDKRTMPSHTPGTGKGEERVRRTGPEPGRRTASSTGALRARGDSTGRLSTGIKPANPIDPNSPHLPTP